MSLPDLMAGVDLSSGLRSAVEDLLALKARASEVGAGARIGVLDQVIMREWAWADRQDIRDTSQPGLHEEAEAMFRTFVKAQV